MFRTLALLADLHLEMRSFGEAKQAISDLESLQMGCADADTYILKTRILMSELA